MDEKLQKTLDEKLQQSFSRVSEQLESVYKGLGEMQTLATGVGDLKKVLSNVKTRGILGEIQLGAILEQILAPEQYAENVATVKGSSERVEYAVRLPGDGTSCVYLPIDAKFPIDAYNGLLDAYDTADAAQVEAAAKVLEQRIRQFAKDIHTKYIHVPETTDFGIMFLPIEGLYAEVVHRGHAGIGLRRQDAVPRLSPEHAVQRRHIQLRPGGHTEKISAFIRVPFIKAGGRHHTPPGGHAVTKHGPFLGRLGPGVDDIPSPLHTGKAPTHHRGNDLPLPQNKHRRAVRGEHLIPRRLRTRLPHRLPDACQHPALLPGKLIPSAHGIRPFLSRRASAAAR